MNRVVLRKNCEKCDKYRVIRLEPTERRREYLLPEPNYHTTKFFTENLLAIEMKKQRYF